MMRQARRRRDGFSLAQPILRTCKDPESVRIINEPSPNATQRNAIPGETAAQLFHLTCGSRSL
jgi:hypothetical protein